MSPDSGSSKLSALWGKAKPLLWQVGLFAARIANQVYRRARKMGLYYWSHRRAFHAYLAEYAPGLRDPKDTRREIRLSPDDEFDTVELTEDGWTVRLPDCCVVCGEATDYKWIDDTRWIEDLGKSFWTPIAATIAGFLLAVIYGGFWMLPTGLIAGLYLGYWQRSSTRVDLRFRRCKWHAEKTGTPRVRLFGSQLIFRVGSPTVRQAFRDKEFLSKEGLIGSHAAKAVPAERSSIPLADTTTETIQHQHPTPLPSIPLAQPRRTKPEKNNGESPQSSLAPTPTPKEEESESADGDDDDGPSEPIQTIPLASTGYVPPSNETVLDGEDVVVSDDAAGVTPSQHCPKCGAEVLPDELKCANCHSLIGKSVRKKKTDQSEPTVSTAAQSPPSNVETSLASAVDPKSAPAHDWKPITRSRIFRSCLDLENVIVEAFILSVYVAGWFIACSMGRVLFSDWGEFQAVATLWDDLQHGESSTLVLFVVGNFIVTLFFVGILRIERLYVLFLCSACAIIAIQQWFPPELGDGWPGESRRDPVLTVALVGLSMLPLALIIPYLGLRFLSFLFGRYFSICERAARGSLFSSEEKGGLSDLVYALTVHFIAVLPAGMVAGVIAAGVTWQGWSLEQIYDVAVGCGVAASLWALFYLPMGLAVVAIERSVNPATAMTWIGKCLGDYISSLLFMIPLLISVGAICGATQYLVVQFWPRGGLFPLIAVGLCLTQYVLVVQFNMLGLIARRNQQQLGWSRQTEPARS